MLTHLINVALTLKEVQNQGTSSKYLSVTTTALPRVSNSRGIHMIPVPIKQPSATVPIRTNALPPIRPIERDRR